MKNINLRTLAVSRLKQQGTFPLPGPVIALLVANLEHGLDQMLDEMLCGEALAKTFRQALTPPPTANGGK